MVQKDDQVGKTKSNRVTMNGGSALSTELRLRIFAMGRIYRKELVSRVAV